jgi:pimeloyl-ACP methyl ester carboxylesterase
VCRSAALLGLVVVVACSLAGSAGGAGERAEHACVKGKELRFRAADGTRLAAHRFGSGAEAVVFAHGNGSNLCEWVSHARRLAAHDFFVLAFDFRGHGLSQDRSFPASERFAGDIAAAVKLVRRLGKREVHLIGSSLGAAASLVAAVNVVPPVASVISLSAPAGFRRQEPLAVAPRLRVPVLYVASQDERLPLADDARAMYEATATTDKQIEIFPGRRHGVRILDGVPSARALVESFIRAH